MNSAEANAGSASRIWNLPNILTMLRIVLVPFFVWFLILDAPGLQAQNGVWRWAAAFVFAVAIYTDKLDGDIARSRGLVTDFGKIADPIADKLLIGSALVMLSLLQELPWWVTILILVREWGITALRFFVIRYGVMPGLSRREAEDRGPDGGDLPLRPSAGVHRSVARRRGVRRHDGRAGDHAVDRRRVRYRGPQAAGRRDQGGERTGKGEQAMNDPNPQLHASPHPTLHPNLHRLAEQAVTGAIGRGLTVATAESLTAGMVAAVLADTPGASGMLQGGVVSYANSVKADVLGVPGELLDAVGSVDGQVAAAMADGARRICGADIGVSTTGVAGPEPHDGKAVGTVFIGVATAEGSTSYPYSFEGSRAEIRALACGAALERLLEALSSEGYPA